MRSDTPADGSRTVAIVGSGVVGTATGYGLHAKGHRVVFCDVAPERISLLRDQGFTAIHADDLTGPEPDVYLISVPTPTVDGRVDISYVTSAAQTVGRAIGSHRGRPLVVVRSTVPPGTTEDAVIPLLEATSGKRAGQDFRVCVNPEFLRAVSAQEDFMEPKVIVIGALDERSERALRRVYDSWPDVPVVTMSLRTAEAAKYVANLFAATKISFFNEMLRIVTAIGADPALAFAAAVLGGTGFWDRWYGTQCGAPYGGACLPKDTAGFLGFAEEMGFGRLMPVLRATIQVNDEMAVGTTEPSDPSPLGLVLPRSA